MTGGVELYGPQNDNSQSLQAYIWQKQQVQKGKQLDITCVQIGLYGCQSRAKVVHFTMTKAEGFWFSGGYHILAGAKSLKFI